MLSRFISSSHQGGIFSSFQWVWDLCQIHFLILFLPDGTGGSCPDDHSQHVVTRSGLYPLGSQWVESKPIWVNGLERNLLLFLFVVEKGKVEGWDWIGNHSQWYLQKSRVSEWVHLVGCCSRCIDWYTKKGAQVLLRWSSPWGTSSVQNAKVCPGHVTSTGQRGQYASG